MGGGANHGGGVPTYKFAGFSQKLHEIKKILVPRGGVPGASQLGSATATLKTAHCNNTYHHFRETGWLRFIQDFTYEVILEVYRSVRVLRHSCVLITWYNTHYISVSTSIFDHVFSYSTPSPSLLLTFWF